MDGDIIKSEDGYLKVSEPLELCFFLLFFSLFFWPFGLE
jgi:hypothetical protein